MMNSQKRSSRFTSEFDEELNAGGQMNGVVPSWITGLTTVHDIHSNNDNK